MIPKNLPPSIPPIERARESLVAAITTPVCIAPSPNFICNAPSAASPIASFSNESSARLHVRQLKSEIGQKMDAMNEPDARIRDHVLEQRAMATVPNPSANSHDQLIKFATNFFTIKNSMAQKAVEADKSFVTDL